LQHFCVKKSMLTNSQTLQVCHTCVKAG